MFTYKINVKFLVGLLVFVFTGLANSDQMCNMTVGELWNHISNNGDLGGDYGIGYYGYDWPGDSSIHNYYLWGSYFHIGAKVNGQVYVTSSTYPLDQGEWAPTDEPMNCGPGVSDYDVTASWQDFASQNPRNATGRHLGLKVILRAYSWSLDPWNDIIAYEFGIIYDSSECDIPGHGAYLDSLYVGIEFDADISGADTSSENMEDMVSFDGWVNGEWPGYPSDLITLLPDSFLNVPDGYPDQYTVYGDNPWEATIHGDTLLIPRNTSYVYDYDNSSTPGNDAVEGGASAGYIGLRLIYAPPTSSDSIWVDEYGDTARIPRVSTHQWWDWETDPATDADYYHYMIGNHPATLGYDFAPPPYDLGHGAFDYRFLQSSGPHRIYNGDTLWFVYAGAVGQGLNGGYDDYFGRGWLRGMRQTLDYALAAYYSGSVHSDPAHPSNPVEDIHWYGLTATREKGVKFSPYVNIPTIHRYPFITLLVKGISGGTVDLYDLTGRVIKTMRFGKLSSANSTLRIPVNGLPTGIYFIRLNTEKTITLKKIVLIK